MTESENAIPADRIINIGIFAHVDAGKTTLTEQFLHICGKIRQAGSVDNGTAQTDFLSVERERGISVNAATTDIEWKGKHINIIDTPGHVDFAGETERAMTAIDGAVLVVSAVEGVQSHTENLWKAFSASGLPCIVFINKIDRAGSDVAAVVESLMSLDGLNPLLLCEAVSQGSRECAACPCIPEDAELCEIIADFNDEAAEAYIKGKPLPHERLTAMLRQAVYERRITPVLCGSSLMAVGCEALLDAVVGYLPPASEKLEDGLSGLIFKIEHDRTTGKIAHIRLFGGSIKNRDSVVINEDVDGEGNPLPPQKVTQIRKFNGSRCVDEGVVRAGDIAALCGLSRARAFDTVGSYRLRDEYRLANPYLTVGISPRDESELTKLADAVRELADEDPLMNYRREPSEKEININITGEIQREILEVLLRERYGIEAVFSPPSVIYKETPSRAGEGFAAYTMPKPCWAVVRLGVEPLPAGSGIVYDGGSVPHNKLFYKYQTHIKTSVFESLEQGNYGWELTDMKIRLLDGEHHTIHTHPLDFFVATPMALMDAINRTGTKLLEPVLDVKLTVGSEHLGRIISDITVMRGDFDDPVIKKDVCILQCRVPVSTSLEWPVGLAAMTGGRAVYSAHFAGYRECPAELGAVAARRGINPLDRAKWILYARGAIRLSGAGGTRGK